ncbi:MAG: pyridoxamine 5'-phosphate oxidase family protein [Nitrospiraceae bacterium]|nr:pyridoxamine 5'-phosphate oxidase family protein [Nitrospiraceae bacterium]
MMRRHKKQIRDEGVIIDLLSRCHVGRLGTNGRTGYPTIKPLNFVFHERKIYFHTAKEGEKIDDVKRDDRVCFEVDLPIAFVRGEKDEPCRAEYLYRSVIVRGRAKMVEDEEEKIAALRLLMRKYQPEGGYGDFRKEKLMITGVVRIDIEEMTGKEDLGKDGMRERALKILEEGIPSPVAIQRDGE